METAGESFIGLRLKATLVWLEAARKSFVGGWLETTLIGGGLEAAFIRRRLSLRESFDVAALRGRALGWSEAPLVRRHKTALIGLRETILARKGVFAGEGVLTGESSLVWEVLVRKRVAAFIGERKRIAPLVGKRITALIGEWERIATLVPRRWILFWNHSFGELLELALCL